MQLLLVLVNQLAEEAQQRAVNQYVGSKILRRSALEEVSSRLSLRTLHRQLKQQIPSDQPISIIGPPDEA